MAGDSAAEPLMRSESHDADVQGQHEELNDVSLLLEKNLRNPGLFVWLLTLTAGITGLLFGCKIPLSAGARGSEFLLADAT
jgi:SP family myo-inositol transporter-like MFS transporter 13